MTIHQTKDAKLHIRVGVDYAPPGSDITIVSQIRGNKPMMMIIDEVFAHEKVKQRMRELDHIFIHGTFSAPPVGYLNATPTPTGPVTTMPTYPQINSLLQGLLSRLK